MLNTRMHRDKAMKSKMEAEAAKNAELSQRILALEKQLVESKNNTSPPTTPAQPSQLEVQLKRMFTDTMDKMNQMEEMFKTSQVDSTKTAAAATPKASTETTPKDVPEKRSSKPNQADAMDEEEEDDDEGEGPDDEEEFITTPSGQAVARLYNHSNVMFLVILRNLFLNASMYTMCHEEHIWAQLR